MSSLRFRDGLVVGALLLAVVSGCASGKRSALVNPKPNVRPVLELTRAPFNESTRFEYSYRMNWLSYDPDGRVDYYLYSIDPPHPTAFNPEPETTWVRTTHSEQTVNFSATRPDSTVPRTLGSSDFHTFVVKAIDNGGAGGPLQSVPLVRSFFTYTVAPTCNIVDPAPTEALRRFVTPSVRITWTGTDPDGIFDSKKPVKYKYLLINQNSPVPYSIADIDPDSVRRYYAPRNWVGWDSTSADTTQVQFTDLVPGADYMFCVISFDEAGAYSPIFNENSNMLNMRISYAAVGGPKLTLFNEFFFYQYPSGFYSTLPQFVIPIEVPAGEEVTINWSGEPTAGSDVRGYRWCLDIDDLSDQTPRDPERTDVRHWSSMSALTTFAVLGPFGGGESHIFYVEALDTNGLKSLGIVQLFSVLSTLDKQRNGKFVTLIVDDMRYKADQKTIGAPCVNPPSVAPWPTAAELDTFLYARGGYPYRCYPTGTISRRGLFTGYEFDTVGTRIGRNDMRLPLATLGQYAHVIWLTDAKSAINFLTGTDPTDPVTSLRYMCSAGHANSVGAYIKQGGQVWLCGGGIGFASMQPFNKAPNDLAAPAPSPTYTNRDGELVPGRFMYDICRWVNSFKSGGGSVTITKFQGRNEGRNLPDYAMLPTIMRAKSVALGDTFPPNRPGGVFFTTTFDVEYMYDRNDIIEDIDPDPFTINEQSTLDTLYKVTGQTLVPARPTPGFVTEYNICMTRYVGPSGQPVIFTGFNVWNFARVDCKQMIDAVLQGIWHLPYIPESVPSHLKRASAPAAWSPPEENAPRTPAIAARPGARARARDR